MFRSSLGAALALVLASPDALAGDPKFEYGKPDEVKDVKDVEWNAAAEAGFIITTGSSETTTATGGFKAARKTGANKLSIEASAAYARSGVRVISDNNGNGMIDDDSEITTQDTTTAETLAGKLRYDRFLTDHNALFIAAVASRDVPAGKESVIGGQAGYSRQLYKSKTAEAVGEFGYDYSRENLISGPSVSIHSARGFVGYKAQLTEGTTLDTSLEGFTNLNRETLPTGKDGGAFRDTRVNARIAVGAKLNKSLAVQTSIDGKYDHRPGPLAIKNLAMGFVPEASSFDTIFKASLIYSF